MPLSKETFDFRALKRDYIHHVIENMSHTGDSSVTVRFGIFGEGMQPNYEIQPASGRPIAYRGNNHKLHEENESYKDDHLTDPYSFDEIKRGFDTSLKSEVVAKNHIWSFFKEKNRQKHPSPNEKQRQLLIAAVMNGTPLITALDELFKLQSRAPDNNQPPPLDANQSFNGVLHK